MEKITRKNTRKPKTKLEISAGGVVYNPHLDKFLLIRDSYGRWALPKGKIEPGETPQATAVREIREETGLKNVKVIKHLGKIKYYYRLHNQPIFKIFHNFLLETQDTTLVPDLKEIKGSSWVDKNEAMNKIAYSNAKKILQKALTLTKKDK